MNAFEIVKETFDEIYGALSGPVILFEEKVGFIKANQSFLDLTKVNPDDFHMNNIFSFKSDDYFNGIKFMQNLPEDHVIEIRDVDGNRIPVRLKINNFKDKKGLYQGSLGFITDLSELTSSKELVKKLTLEIEALKDQLAGELPSKVLEERKKLEQEVKESKDFLENIFITIADGIMVTDNNGHIVKVNRAVEKITGYREDELIGKLAMEMSPLDEEHRKAGLNMMEQLYEKGFLENWEHEWYRRDGSLLPVEFNIVFLKDHEGNISGAVAAIREITERRKSEEALKMSEKRYYNLIEYANDAVISANEEGIITTVNKKAEDMYGYSREELLGKSVFLLMALSEREQQRKGLEIFKKSEEFSAIEKPIEGNHVRKDGREFPVESSISLLEMHGKYTFTSFTRDITDRKRDVEELRETKEQMENFIENSFDPIIICDHTGHITKANKAFIKMVGYLEKEVIGELIYDFAIAEEGTYESTTGELCTIDKDYFDEAWEQIIQFYENGKICNWVQHYMNKDHKLVPCNHNAIFLSNDKGERTIAFSIIRDLTEQKKAVRAIEEANRCRSQFFTNISHEFRTPLTLAMGPIESILRGEYGKINGNFKKQLSLALKNSRKLLKLINQLLEFSRLDSGSQRLVYEKKNLKDFIATILDSFSFIAENQKITLTFDPGSTTNGAYINPGKMEKVLFNLIGNAFKFTPAGGKITVGVRGNNGSGDKGNEHVTISVEDTGIGIEEESLPRIFERFHQVNDGFDRKYEGTGIGLAISKELVELMGGSIEVASEYGKGTTFSVHLSVGKEQIREGSYNGNGSGAVLSHQPEIELSDLDHGNGNGKGVLEESISGNKPLILIIDDNPDMRQYVSDSVKKEYDYITARSGEEGLKKLEEQQPDVILCDVMMPGMDGSEFLKQVKSTPRLKEIPFIFLTARADSEMKIEGLEEGADDYVVKPFNSLELLARIKSLLRIRALMRRNTAQKKEISSLTQKLQKRYGHNTIVGNSPPMRKVFQMLESVSDSELTVLIMGETGTGKELIANALHYNSPRKDGPFIAVNCGAIPRELMEREFFGHVKGAYTGAHQDREGYFEKANGGTLFLDEIGELDKSLQVKLLRVLERGEINRVGNSETTKVNVRLIAASNKDLRTEVQEGNFREDLYYRIYVLPVYVPPLRERKEDIPLLLEHFMKSFQSESKTEVPSLSEKEMKLLMNYSYPGNVRELKHVMERYCLLGSSAGNLFSDLSESSGKLSPALFYDEILSSASPLRKAKEHTERDIITHTLKICDNDYGESAKKLNICLASLYKKIKEYGVNQ